MQRCGDSSGGRLPGPAHGKEQTWDMSGCPAWQAGHLPGVTGTVEGRRDKGGQALPAVMAIRLLLLLFMAGSLLQLLLENLKSTGKHLLALCFL